MARLFLSEEKSHVLENHREVVVRGDQKKVRRELDAEPVTKQTVEGGICMNILRKWTKMLTPPRFCSFSSMSLRRHRRCG